MPKNQVLPNGCIRMTKTIMVGGKSITVTIEKDRPEVEAQTQRAIETRNLRHDGFRPLQKQTRR